MANDLNKFRATFGVAYPTEKVNVDRQQNGEEIRDRIISIKQNERKLSKIKFRRCKPVFSKDAGISIIADIFFEECFFGSCFLGSTTYKTVRFNRCKFDKSDFMNARFINCEFVSCEFVNCAAWNIKFEKTIINPISFIDGIPFPKDNYSSETESILNKKMRQYIETTLPVSRELLQSAISIQHAEHIDIATCLYKEKILENRVYKLIWNRDSYLKFGKKRTDKFWGALRDFLIIPIEWANLLATKGGTSLSRLVIMFLTMNCLVFPAVYTVAMIKNEKYQAFLSDTLYSQKIISSIELFLGFGFTNYKSIESLGRVIMVSQPIVGLIWFAFLVPVLLRRAYR